jgi:RNA polymerase sigma factor (sigma-70 family)
MKRPNGNLLDKMVCDAIKNLSEDSSSFFRQLDETKKVIQTTNDDYENRLAGYRKAFEDNKKQIDALIQALTKSDESTPAHEYINNQINVLHEKNVSIQKSIEEWENIGKSQELSDEAFEILRDMLKSFALSFDTMDVERKRATLRMFLRRVIWDGTNIHLVLFGSDDPFDSMTVEDDPPDFQSDGENKGSISPSYTQNTSQSVGVANEILMYFRNLKKSAQDVLINDPIDTDKEGNTLTLGDVIADDECIIDNVDLKIKTEQLREYIIDSLDPREREIIRMRYGMDGTRELTQREVAKKLDISRSYVSRIEKKALIALRNRFEPPEKKK